MLRPAAGRLPRGTVDGKNSATLGAPLGPPGGWESDFFENKKKRMQNMLQNGWSYQGVVPVFLMFLDLFLCLKLILSFSQSFWGDILCLSELYF